MAGTPVGLVLEGGAMRGMYTAGVLDVMLEGQVAVDGMVGVSAGALFGVNYLSGQPGRVIRYSKRYNADPRYMGVRSLLTTGNVVNREFAYYRVPMVLDPFDEEAFLRSGVPYYVVVTALEDGEPRYVRLDQPFRQMEVLRASSAMPFVSRPVEVDGALYLDGGVADSIPFEFLRGLGYGKLIVILTRDVSYRKSPMPELPIALRYRKYPAFQERLRRRHETYNRSVARLEELERQGEAFLIRPSSPIEIKRIEKDPAKLQAVYELGLRDGRAVLPALLDYLKK